ncbi:MAG TPA: hypothetical protein VHZ09_15865 [Acidobacteriaceae bacterium]|jgi:hypothetical protein|nr:hypothetical protein [Acidobacteriaceae bacterium]
MQRRSSIPLALLGLLVPLTNAQQIALRAGTDLPSIPPAAFSAEPAAIMPVSAPRPLSQRALTLYDWSLLAAAGTLRFLDYKTTEKCLSDPANFHEVELPTSLVSNKPAFAAFESSTVVANYFAYRLVARRHRTIARLGQYINIGSIAWAVGGNYTAIAEHFPHNVNVARPQRTRP